MALEINQPLLSHADYLRLPDDLRGEVIDGVFYVTPSPKLRHQQVLDRFYAQLTIWLNGQAAPGLVLTTRTGNCPYLLLRTFRRFCLTLF